MQPNCQKIALFAVLTLALAGAVQSRAQDMHDLLAQALDQNVKSLEIGNLPVHDALAALEKQTGVRTLIADEVLALLPYGERTQITLKLADVPLRRGMERAFAGLGLTLRIDRDNVVLDPSQMLARLGRRLTIDEAALLERLAATPLSDLKPDETPIRFELPPATQPREAFNKALEATPAADALRQLDAATAALGWVWLVDGNAVVIRDRREFVRRALEQHIDVNYQRTPLDGLLVELGRRIGVPVSFEPGCLKRIDAREQIVDLVQRDVSVGQILERIAGNTGLRYEVTTEGVRIAGPGEPGRGASANAAGRVVAHLIMKVADGTTLLLPIREGELTTDELSRIEQFRGDGIKAVREFLAKPAP